MSDRVTIRREDVAPAARASRVMSAPRTLAACAGLLALGGCASGPEGAGDAGDEASGNAPSEPFERLVATDLVSTLMQLPDTSPFATTVQLAAPRTAFGSALDESLRDAGYGVQRVASDQGRHHVRYRTLATEDERGRLTTYALAVADLALERDYRAADGLPVPASAVRVRGASPTRVIVNDDVYRQRGGEASFPSGVVFLDADGAVLERREREVRVTDASARAAGERVEAARFLVLARANLFLADRLASEPEAAGTRVPIRQLAVRFPDARGLRLGDPNKRALERLAAGFRGSSDRFSISGCRHGESLLWDGTESDSLARSQRVKEELVRTGVPSARVREEGCFETRYADELAPLTVLVTLERRERTTLGFPDLDFDGVSLQ